MKYVLVIPDGMGDSPVRSLRGRTPLEAARTPHMDFFASEGLVGLANNIPKGCIPGTDIGCLSVFGYDPKKYFTGRGPLEAAEHGLKLRPGQMAFRCNLVTVDSGRLMDFSGGHVSLGEARPLIEFFQRQVQKEFGSRVRFYPGDGTGYRNLMILSQQGDAFSKVRCAPPHDHMGEPYARWMPKAATKSAQGAAAFLRRLMTRSLELLKAHPVNRRREKKGLSLANMIWLWGQGEPPDFPSYAKRFGLRGGVISAVDLVKGIGIHAGLEVIEVPGVTGYFDTDYAAKARYALRALERVDFVAIHVESTDEAGHMGDARLKIQAIEDVDRLVLGTLRRGLKKFGEYRLLLTPDHFTCVETKTHSSDPVPFLVYASRRGRAEGSDPIKFSEKTARRSGLRVPRGHELMEKFICEKF